MTIDIPEEVAVVMNILYKAGVFNVTNGKVILNFDQAGVLTDIEVNQKLYKRGKSVIPMPSLVLITK